MPSFVNRRTFSRSTQFVKAKMFREYEPTCRVRLPYCQKRFTRKLQLRDVNEDKSPDRHRRRRRRGHSVLRATVLRSGVFPTRLKIGVLFTPLQRNCGQQSFESRCLLSIAFSSRTDEHPRRKRKTGLQGRVLQAGSQSCEFDARTGPGNRRLRIDMTMTDIGQLWRRSRPPGEISPAGVNASPI